MDHTDSGEESRKRPQQIEFKFLWKEMAACIFILFFVSVSLREQAFSPLHDSSAFNWDLRASWPHKVKLTSTTIKLTSTSQKHLCVLRSLASPTATEEIPDSKRSITTFTFLFAIICQSWMFSSIRIVNRNNIDVETYIYR